MGFGASSITNIFSGKEVKVDSSLSKMETAMQGAGALEVDKVESKAGNFVFVNAHSVGLSSKLADFQGLAASMHHYEHALGELTGKLTTKKTSGQSIHVGPPEWQGN